MQELEKILEEIKESSIIVATSKEHYIHPQDGRFVEEVVLLDCVEDIIRKHMNDGWIPVEERLPEVDAKNKTTECVLVTDGIFIWMAYYVPDCWIFADCSNTSIKIDWSDIIAWRPLPEPYRPERSEGE